MLPEKNPLPGPKIALTTFDRDHQRRQREDRSNVGWHVVRALRVMTVRGITVGYQTGREVFQVTANRRIRILADDQRCARMVDEQVTKTLDDPRSFDNLLNLTRDLVGSAAPGLDRQLLPVHDGTSLQTELPVTEHKTHYQTLEPRSGSRLDPGLWRSAR